jgi:predicted dehydrogenase
MQTNPITIAIVGAGNIAGPYAEDLLSYEHVVLAGIADLDAARAEALAVKHGVSAYASLAEVLADPAIDLVVNLTIHHAHYAVSRQIIEAGKHVYSEKPLATSYAEARELVELADKHGVRLGASPFTYMGEAQQTAWKTLRESQIGTVRLAYAEVNWGRIESWHPNPGPFYEVGALWDVGVYPLTMLTTLFGPARQISSYGKLLYPDRVTKEGIPFSISTPDFVVSMIELANGTLVRLTTNFYVKTTQQNSGIELHGDGGTLHLASWQSFDAWVGYADFGKPFADVPHVRPAPPKTAWGRGVAEMAQAMQEDRPHRATGKQAAHIVEILEGASTSIHTGRPVAIASTFEPITPLEWAV